MSKYIEEYLVELGFDLNSEQGKEYLKICNEIDKKQKDLEKSGKSASEQAQKTSEAQKNVIDGNNRESESIDKLNESRRKSHNPPHPANTSAPRPVQQVEEVTEEEPQETVQQPQKAKKSKPKKGKSSRPVETAYQPKQSPKQTPTPNFPKRNERQKVKEDKTAVEYMGGLEKSLRQLGTAWVQFERGNIFGAFKSGASSVQSFHNYMNNLGTSFSATNTKAGGLKKTLGDLFGGKAAQSAVTNLAGAGSEAVEAGESAAGLSAGAALGAAGGIAAGVTLTTKAIWNMADGLAQANTNVETMARQLWITDSAAMQLSGTLNAMGKTTADLNEISINPTLNAQFKELQKNAQSYTDTQKIQSSSDKWAKEVETPWEILQQNLAHRGQEFQSFLQTFTGPAFSSILNTLNSGMGSNTSASQNAASTYAPQNYSYSTMNEGAKITYSPKINVQANSSSAQDIADATAQAAQQSFSEAALIKNIQGMGR